MEEKLVAKQTRADGCICRLETSNLFPCCFPCQTTVAARTHLFRISQYPSVAKHVDVEWRTHSSWMAFFIILYLHSPVSSLTHTHTTSTLLKLNMLLICRKWGERVTTAFRFVPRSLTLASLFTFTDKPPGKWRRVTWDAPHGAVSEAFSQHGLEHAHPLHATSAPPHARVSRTALLMLKAPRLWQALYVVTHRR